MRVVVGKLMRSRGSIRVLRGGGWNNVNAWYLRSSSRVRGGVRLEFRDGVLGFHLVRGLP